MSFVPDADVVLVGCGPVGAALANLLGADGLRVVVLEREPSVYHLPRAVSADGEVMRLFQTLGITDAILPNMNVSRNIRHLNAEGKLLVLLERGGVGPEGWNHAYRFHQPELEAGLRAPLAGLPTVEMRLRCEAFALDEAEDHVRVRYEDLSNGHLGALTARYVVGCDGARSVVRRFIGSALQDLRSHERWVVVDMILDVPPAGLEHACDASGRIIDAVQYCDPVRPTTFVPMPGKRCRWEFMLMPGDDPVAITQPAGIFALLAPWQVTPATARIERAVVYTFHSALATQWRRGRLILAGDSAHQTPPFLGQGMCSGLRDANNLAWKLREVIAGRAPEGLLDSYQSERGEHVRAFIELAVELGGIIQATDPEKARRRDADLLANPTLLRPIAPPLGPGLHGDAPPPAGTRAAQPRLADGRRLDDVVGYRFAVLARPALLAAAAQAGLDLRGAVGVAATGEAGDYLDRVGTESMVIRPDRHILGVAASVAELEALLGRLPGATAAP